MSQALEDIKELNVIPAFETRMTNEEYGYTTDRLDVMQINVGRLCNLACKHCHVEAGPNRTEVMGSLRRLRSCDRADESGDIKRRKVPPSASVLCGS